MPRSYTKLTYHCTFSTKGRRQALYENMRASLHAYMARIINDDFGFAREIGGTADHVHILCDLRPKCEITTLMRRLKSLSSGWLHREFQQLADFAWQEGYGAFSVSASVAGSVKRYIWDQERHHKGLSFEEEFQRLLEKHGIDFQRKHLF